MHRRGLGRADATRFWACPVCLAIGHNRTGKMWWFDRPHTEGGLTSDTFGRAVEKLGRLFNESESNRLKSP